MDSREKAYVYDKVRWVLQMRQTRERRAARQRV